MDKIRILNFFSVKFLEVLSNCLIDIHLIIPPNYFWILRQKKSKSFCLEKIKVPPGNTLEQPVLGEFRWGFFFFLLLYPTARNIIYFVDFLARNWTIEHLISIFDSINLFSNIQRPLWRTIQNLLECEINRNCILAAKEFEITNDLFWNLGIVKISLFKLTLVQLISPKFA